MPICRDRAALPRHTAGDHSSGKLSFPADQRVVAERRVSNGNIDKPVYSCSILLALSERPPFMRLQEHDFGIHHMFKAFC